MGRGMKVGGRSSGDVDVERVVVARRPTSATACLRYPHAPRDNTSPKRSSERPSRSVSKTSECAHGHLGRTFGRETGQGSRGGDLLSVIRICLDGSVNNW